MLIVMNFRAHLTPPTHPHHTPQTQTDWQQGSTLTWIIKGKARCSWHNDFLVSPTTTTTGNEYYTTVYQLWVNCNTLPKTHKYTNSPGCGLPWALLISHFTLWLFAVQLLAENLQAVPLTTECLRTQSSLPVWYGKPTRSAHCELCRDSNKLASSLRPFLLYLKMPVLTLSADRSFRERV